MRYIINHYRNGECIYRDNIKNLMTIEGRTYIFRKCFDKDYSDISEFAYRLINGLGFGGIADTDTIASRRWVPYTLYDYYPYTPSLIPLDEGGIIAGNLVEIILPSDGIVAGFSISGNIILSVAVFSQLRPVKSGDVIKIVYNIEK